MVAEPEIMFRAEFVELFSSLKAFLFEAVL